MYRTLKIKLDKSNELIQTAKLWNAACKDVIDYGFAAHDYNKTRLNKATYKDLRDKYPTLPSALHQTARDQASDMLKRLKFEKKPFKHPLGAVRFDIRTMKVFLESGPVKAVKGKYQYLRSKLQSIGTRSAKRKLCELSGRERRFQRDVNHNIAN